MEHLHAGRVRKALLEKFGEPPVLLDQRGRAATANSVFTQRPQARPDLYEVILRAEPELIDDPGGDFLIVEKILPQALRGPGLQSRQGVLDRGSVHG